MIKETDKRILNALSCAINGRTVTWGEELVKDEWEKLYRAADSHNILPLVADALRSDLPEPYANCTRQKILHQASRSAELCLLLEHLYSRDLHPLVVKGMVCRSLYPEPEHRPSTDEDLLIDPAEFPRMHEALLEYGLNPIKPEDMYKSYEVSYQDAERKLYLEVHRALFTRELPYLNRLNGFFRGVHARAKRQEIYGVQVLTLSPDDHVLFLLLHAMKHFLHSGVGIRQVCDIALYSERYGDSISWGGLRRKLSELGAIDFARAIYGIAEKYLLTEKEMTPYLSGWKLEDVDFEPMLEDIMEGGLYGTSTMSRAHSATMTLNAASTQQTGGLKALLHAVFRPRRSLVGRYRYLEKAPFLLPVAWAHRLLRYSRELLRGDRRTNSPLDSIRVGSERIRLLKQYHIISSKKLNE